MATDKIRKYVLPNIPYLFIGWFCLKIGTAYRLAAGAGFGEKLLGLGQTIGTAFASFAPGLAPLDWFVGIVGAVGFRLLIYCKAKKAKKFRRDAEYGTARWGTEKDIKPFVDPKFENNMLLTATERLTMNTRPNNPPKANTANRDKFPTPQAKSRKPIRAPAAAPPPTPSRHAATSKNNAVSTGKSLSCKKGSSICAAPVRAPPSIRSTDKVSSRLHTAVLLGTNSTPAPFCTNREMPSTMALSTPATTK